LTNQTLASVSASAGGTLRHDWTVHEIEAIYSAPLPDLIFRAQSVHRAKIFPFGRIRKAQDYRSPAFDELSFPVQTRRIRRNG
jgi:hypothetical protein